jgi:hypothetical protein
MSGALAVAGSILLLVLILHHNHYALEFRIIMLELKGLLVIVQVGLRMMI